jgi:3-oxoacyl-[acyl-carrier-protein] synthase II
MSERRVVITGLGVLAACGIGKDAYFEGLCSTPPEGMRLIPDFDPLPHFKNAKEARRIDRFAQFALAAAEEAFEQAGDVAPDPDRAGVVLGTGVGGLTTLEAQVEVFHSKGPRRVSPFLVPMMMSNAAAAALSMRYGYRGPCEATVTACAASTQAIGNAVNMIRWGRCDVMLTGGTEASNTPVGMQGFINMTATSAAGISRPFDVDRDGFLHAEGCGVMVIEEMSRAEARGANILGEIVGYASTADAGHITAPSPGGAGAAACMDMAVNDADLDPSEVRQINAHGTSTPLNDAAEAEAINKIFGSPGPPVTSTKGVTGHALGGAGAIEVAAVLLSMSRGIIPPTAGFKNADPELPELDIVTEPRAWEPGPTLSNSFGFGGHNATLVIAPPE